LIWPRGVFGGRPAGRATPKAAWGALEGFLGGLAEAPKWLVGWRPSQDYTFWP
jgi:hypothetical protein